MARNNGLLNCAIDKIDKLLNGAIEWLIIDGPSFNLFHVHVN